MPSFALSEITYLASIPLSFTENRCTQDYDREYCVDLAQLSAFLHASQPVAAESLDLGGDSPTRRKFLARLQGEITKRGTRRGPFEPGRTDFGICIHGPGRGRFRG